MTTNLARLYVEPTPQTEPVDARQVRNNAGGFVFALDDWKRLDRFLVLGSESATYYQSAKSLTRENAAGVLSCYGSDARRTVARIVEVSLEGNAPRVSPAIFALALGACHSDVEARRLAYAALPQVCRTASHLFEFLATVRALGKGWGRGLKRAVADWYASKDVARLAYQAVKYRDRNGMTHARVLRTTHPRPDADDRGRRDLYRWMLDGTFEADGALPGIVRAHVEAMASDSAARVAELATNLPWEAIPTWAHGHAEVWRALLPTLGTTALLRNLGRLTRLGVLGPLGRETDEVVRRLLDADRLKAERVHPFSILVALGAYRLGRPIMAQRRGVGDEAAWEPVGQIVKALDEAFHLGFGSVLPSGKRHLLALDVSGSMGTTNLMGAAISAREASAAMALVTAATEPRTHVVGFSNGMTELDITGGMRLDQAVKEVSDLPFQSTDCGLPMRYALERGIAVDTFVIYTDNETYAGREHPHLALERYRRKTGIPARLVVVGMTSTGFTIANPTDAGMLDLVGFDSAAPGLMADFSRG